MKERTPKQSASWKERASLMHQTRYNTQNLSFRTASCGPAAHCIRCRSASSRIRIVMDLLLAEGQQRGQSVLRGRGALDRRGGP